MENVVTFIMAIITVIDFMLLVLHPDIIIVKIAGISLVVFFYILVRLAIMEKKKEKSF